MKKVITLMIALYLTGCASMEERIAADSMRYKNSVELSKFYYCDGELGTSIILRYSGYFTIICKDQSLHRVRF